MLVQDLLSLGQALVDINRVRILAALRQGELCVCELVDALEISQSTLSGHLQVLRLSDLVQTRKEGRWIYYALTPRFAELIEAIFERLPSNASTDPRLRRDAERIAQCLVLRENGRCVLGFTALRKAGRRPQKPQLNHACSR